MPRTEAVADGASLRHRGICRDSLISASFPAPELEGTTVPPPVPTKLTWNRTVRMCMQSPFPSPGN